MCVHAYIHIYIYVYIYTYAHIYICKYLYAYVWTYSPTHVHTRCIPTSRLLSGTLGIQGRLLELWSGILATIRHTCTPSKVASSLLVWAFVKDEQTVVCSHWRVLINMIENHFLFAQVLGLSVINKHSLIFLFSLLQKLLITESPRTRAKRTFLHFRCWGNPGIPDCDARGGQAPKPPRPSLWDDGLLFGCQESEFTGTEEGAVGWIQPWRTLAVFHSV